jgi:hypothetical protein
MLVRKNTREKTIRMIHSSHSFEKFKNSNINLKKNLRRKSVYRDIFFTLDEEKENSSQEDENPDISIIIYYDGRKIATKFNRHKTFSEFTKFLKKKYFKSGFEENYKIFYDQQEVPMNDKRKIKKIVDSDRSEIKFMLKAKKEAFINSKLKKIYIELENIPSFMDLSEQINNFLNCQKDYGINFDIIYKDNYCRILFSSSETAFSFVSYMTNIKFSNKFYRKLKIDIKYNALEDTNIYKSSRFLRPSMSEEIIINKSKNPNVLNLNEDKGLSISNSYTNIKNRHKLKMKNNRFKNYTESNYNIYDDYFKDNFKSVQDSSPYQYEKRLAKIQENLNKKKWVGNKNFFTNINKNSFNRIISPSNFLKKFRDKFNNKKDGNIISPFMNKIYKLKISDI